MNIYYCKRWSGFRLNYFNYYIYYIQYTYIEYNITLQPTYVSLSIGRRLNTFTSREESYLRPKLSSLRSSQSQKHGSKQ